MVDRLEIEDKVNLTTLINKLNKQKCDDIL